MPDKQITTAQVTKLVICMKEQGWDRKAELADLFGVESTKDLTFDQANQLLDMFDSMKEPNNIYARIRKAQDKVGTAVKTGWNAGLKYKYVTEKDVIDAVNALMGEYGITFTFTVKEILDSGNPHLVRMVVEYGLVNIDNPNDRVTGCVIGEGSDKQDKGAYKAMTGATKYALMKAFMIPTGDEPEADDTDSAYNDHNKAKPQRAKQPVSVIVQGISKYNDMKGIYTFTNWFSGDIEKQYTPKEHKEIMNALEVRTALIRGEA